MKYVVALCLLVFCSGCASAAKWSQVVPPESPDDKLQIIDVHLHTIFTALPARLNMPLPAKPQKVFFDELKDAGVVGGVALALPGDYGYVDLREQGIISCAGVGDTVDAGSIERGLKSGKYACIKVYLGYYFKYAYDRLYDPVYRLAEKYDVPVIFHTGDTVTKTAMVKYADPLTIDEVAVRHPKVRFVIAHCGNPWIESAAEVAYKNPNVYLDGSAFLTGDLNTMTREKVFKYVVKPLKWIFGYVEDPTKIMFGSDWPLTNIWSYLEPFKHAIPREYWRKVFHDNALRVFKDLDPTFKRRKIPL